MKCVIKALNVRQHFVCVHLRYSLCFVEMNNETLLVSPNLLQVKSCKSYFGVQNIYAPACACSIRSCRIVCVINDNDPLYNQRAWTVCNRDKPTN